MLNIFPNPFVTVDQQQSAESDQISATAGEELDTDVCIIYP